MPTNSYDVIVMGDDTAGLIAAALCARRGMRVLCLRGGASTRSYQLGSHRLPTRALPFAGFGAPTISRVLDELHFDHTLKRRLRERSPAFQLVASDARIDVTDDDEALARAIQREFGHAEGSSLDSSLVDALIQADSVSDSLEQLLSQDAPYPPTGFWSKREAGKMASRIGDAARDWWDSAASEARTANFCRMPAAMASFAAGDAIAPAACARALAHWRQGAPRLAGDLRGLEELLEEKLIHYSGEVRQGRPAELRFSWGRVSGVRLENGEELGAEQVIAAMPADKLLGLVGGKHGKRLAQCASHVQIAGYRYVLNLLVGEAGLPQGMCGAVLARDKSEDVDADEIAIYLGVPDDEARVVVTVEANCALPDTTASPESIGLEERFADLRVRVRKHLEAVMPFVGEHIVLAHSPHEAIPAEGVGGKLGLAEPIAPTPRWRWKDESAHSSLGLAAIPYDVGIKRLTVANSQTLPALGLEGDFIAGYSAAKIVSAAAGKKRDVSKTDLLARSR